jgi:hypothetical protein
LTRRKAAVNKGSAKVEVQCYISAEPRSIIKVLSFASIPKAIGMVNIAISANPKAFQALAKYNIPFELLHDKRPFLQKSLATGVLHFLNIVKSLFTDFYYL